MILPAVKGLHGDALKIPFLSDLQKISTTQGAIKPLGGQASFQLSWRAAILWLIWVLLVIAAARPQWVGEPIKLRSESRDILLVTDISTSMLEPDFVLGRQRIDRLTAVKKTAQDFMDKRVDDRVGLILFGTNARMTDGQTCFNIAKSSIGNGRFRGYAYPYSTSFIDITNYAGGVKIFLPLFDQVNSVELNDMNHSFFSQLIYLFRHFFMKSFELASSFVRADGFRAMECALLKIDASCFNKAVLSALNNVWKSLSDIEHKTAMLTSIWLDFNIWQRLCEEEQIFVYRDLLPDIFKSDRNLFSSLCPVNDLCAVICSEPLRILRAPLWDLLNKLATKRWTILAQDTLFSYGMTFGCDSQLEALNCLYDLCKSSNPKVGEFFMRNGRFHPYLQLLSVQDENIRLTALKMIFLIKEKMGSSMSADEFDLIIVKVIGCMNTEGITENTWNLILSYAFNEDQFSETMRYAFPLLCAFSHHFSVMQIIYLIHGLISSKIDSDKSKCRYITGCRLWYFYTDH